MPDLIPVDHDPFQGDGGSPSPPTNGIPPVNYADTTQADQGLMDTLSRLANINQQRFATPQQQPQQPQQQPQLTQEGYPYWQADQGQPGMPPASSLQPQQPAPIYDQPAGPQTPFKDTRGAYAQELANPIVRDRLLSFMMAEVGTQGPQAQQAFLESVLNRAAARGQSIMRTLAADYYPPETLMRAAQYRAGGMNPAQYEPMMGEVMSGSNLGNYTTGNASRDPRTGRDVGFAGGPQTAKFVGERYGVEGPDLGWARSIGYEGGAGAPDDSDPWERAAYRQANAVRPRGGRQEGLATRLLERYLPHVAQGMVDWAATPGRAYKEGLSPEEEANWGAGTAMGMLGTGAVRAASPMGAPGELGIFGGKLSQTADHAALARAQQMETAGIPPAKIHQDTGWFKGTDGQWRYEINDQGARKIPGVRAGQMDQVVEHPELYEAYPQMRKAGASLEGGANRGAWTPAATGRPGYMNVTGETVAKQESIALHEAQHAVQDIEGFSPGTSVQGVGETFTPEGLARYVMNTAESDGVNLAQMNPAQRDGYARNILYDLYRQASGEVESRNVQFRQKMSPEERRARPPWQTQDVPTEYQYHAGPGAPAAYEPVPVEHDPFAFDTHPGLISTRFPTAVRAKEKPLEQRLGIDTDAMRMDPDAFKRNVFLVRRYPNLTREEVKGPPDQVADNFINHVKDNLLWLHDHVPPEIRDRSKLWYEGANKIIKQRAEETGLPETSVAAVYAAMSPQKDWFQNVSLGDRVMAVYLNHGEQKFTPRMLTTGKEIFGKPQYADLFKALQSRSLNELTDPVEKAMWIRIFDQAHQSPAYKLVQPEGTFGDVVKTNSGAPVKVAWGSNVEIAKAVQAIEAKGDVNTISPLLGQRHKVRSFYNNMLYPNAPFGDVTIDTHAVAAGLLRPLSGNSVEVSHNFGNWPGAGIPATRSSSITGTDGLYGMYADAYRKAAAERGVLPREMQSITWEAVRGLFPERFKAQPKNVAAINAMWKNYRNGSITLDQVREAVNGYAGGIRPPDWAQ